MEYMHKIKKMLFNELEEYDSHTKLTGADLEIIWKLTDTIKNLDKIEMLEQDGGYSEGRRRTGGYHDGMSYDDDMMYSERRGRGRYAKRDSMGRYSSDDGMSYDDYMDEGTSYRGGYSKDDAKDHMMKKLGAMMEGANPKEREALKEAMRAIERA